ncbi:MAG: shikimate kinase [Acidobacteriota bacterium]|nr:shikimate kinase [Acidobacteriota bacterium]
MSDTNHRKMSGDQDHLNAEMARCVVIVGFMGAGKSSVARELARLLGVTVIDLDDHITRREGRTPQELIDEDGEPRFREIETRALEEILSDDTARFVALGGGALTAPATRELLARRNCFIIWLDAPFELCWQRIAGDEARPFAREREIAHRLYEERRKFYERADCRFEVSEGAGVKTVATEIEEIIRPQIKWAEG